MYSLVTSFNMDFLIVSVRSDDQSSTIRVVCDIAIHMRLDGLKLDIDTIRCWFSGLDFKFSRETGGPEIEFHLHNCACTLMKSLVLRWNGHPFDINSTIIECFYEELVYGSTLTNAIATRSLVTYQHILTIRLLFNIEIKYDD